MTCPRPCRDNFRTRRRTPTRTWTVFTSSKGSCATSLFSDMTGGVGPRKSGGDDDNDEEDEPISQLDFDTDLSIDDDDSVYAFTDDDAAPLRLEYDMLDEEDEILDELDLAEEMGILDDDEFLMQIDDDFIISAKRFDEDDPITGRSGLSIDLDEIEATELGDAFDEDGREFRNIDDDTLLEILGLPDEMDASAELKLTEKEAKRAAQYLDDVFGEKSRKGSTQSEAAAATAAGLEDANETYLTATAGKESTFSFQPLEAALAQGVLPTEAGVGTGALPGDFNFDPLNLSTKDYFKKIQRFLISLLPGDLSLGDDGKQSDEGYDGGALPKNMRALDELEVRPASLIIRDYRESEIRHGRLVSTV